MQLKKKMPWLILLVVFLPFIPILLMIDDWSRDWTTNSATTRPDHDDPTLRSKSSSLSPAEVAEKLSEWVDAQPQWELVSREPVETGFQLTLIHSTRLWRFRDDVTVTIEAGTEGSTINATSQSRIGQGDLGQNPRNLRELLQAIPG